MSRFIKLVVWAIIIGSGVCAYSAYTKIEDAERLVRRTVALESDVSVSAARHPQKHKKLTKMQQQKRIDKAYVDDSLYFVEHLAATVGIVMVLSLFIIPRLNRPAMPRTKATATQVVKPAVSSETSAPEFDQFHLDYMLKQPITGELKKLYDSYSVLATAREIRSTRESIERLDSRLRDTTLTSRDRMSISSTRVFALRSLKYLSKGIPHEMLDSPEVKKAKSGTETSLEYFKMNEFTKYDPRWFKLRVAALEKNQNLYGINLKCAQCGRTKAHGVYMNVDHISPRKTNPELALDPENLQIFCSECNHGNGNQYTTDWREELER